MNSPGAAEKKAWIRPLPEQLVNKIAAGEVVERPAAIVKELVENSLDAGATRIEILAEKAGAKLIRISDNGCGIADDQIEIAFSRHATSKISNYTDLDNLLTYGFRGEALPSIASVSRTRAVSRTTESDLGVEIIVEGGIKQSLKPISASKGTIIEVANLFFNTPARRKFLKAESTESRYISRTATALALGRPDVAFVFTVNGRTVFNVAAGQTLAERASSLLSLKNSLVELNGESDVVRVHGIIGTPEATQANRNSQYLFINGRYIHSATLSHAISAGFGEMLPKGRHPVGAILIEVPPGEVDVNVHPTKTEVRLSKEREIHDYLMRLVRNSLQSEGTIPTMSGVGESTDTSFSYNRPSSNSNRIFRNGPAPSVQQSREFLSELYRPPGNAVVDTNTGEILEANNIQADISRPILSGLRLVGRFCDLYLLFQQEEELLIVDQHTAHERVLFEQTLNEMGRHAVVAQQMLLPVQVELSPEQFSYFDEAADMLNANGFTVSPFGGRTVNIEAMPTILSKKSPEKSFLSIIDDIGSLKKTGYDLHKAIAQSMACRAAVMAGDRLSDAEATGLVQALLKCDNMFSCPHGRPTFIKIPRRDFDRQFGRC